MEMSEFLKMLLRFTLSKDDQLLFAFLLPLLLAPAGGAIGMAADKKCVSVNHCDQRCFVENLTEKCYCIERFTADKGKCVLDDAQKNGSILFVDSFEDMDFIRQRDLFGNATEILVPPLPKHRIFSVLSNPLNQSAFFLAASTNDTLGAAKIFHITNDVSRCIFYGRGLRRIAFDWVTENMYYAAKGVGIGACGFKHKEPTCFHPLIPFENDSNEPTTPEKDESNSSWFRNCDFYGDLAVEPQSGRLFWVEYQKDRRIGVIMVAGMDGEEPRVLSYGAASAPGNFKQDDVNQMMIKTMSIDYARRMLYVVQYGRVWSLRLDQVQPADRGFIHVLSEQSSIDAIGDDVHSILAFDAYFYYMSRKTSELLKLSKKGNVTERIFKKSDPTNIDWLGFAIRNLAFYKSIKNPCEALTCSYMCLLAESDPTVDGASPQLAPRGRCVCRDGAVDMGDGRCVVMSIVADPHAEVDLLKEKRHLSVTDLYHALNAYRDEMQGDSLSISWLLIAYSLPAVAVNVGLCASLIHVIVTDYVEYIHLIDQ